jgi:hypothetical protein
MDVSEVVERYYQQIGFDIFKKNSDALENRMQNPNFIGKTTAEYVVETGPILYNGEVREQRGIGYKSAYQFRMTGNRWPQYDKFKAPSLHQPTIPRLKSQVSLFRLSNLSPCST